MKDCYRCGWIFDDKEDFCPECGMENFSDNIVPSVNKSNKPSYSGAWILVHGRAKNGKETNPPLYTQTTADDIKHKATGRRYCRGRYVLFRESRGEKPPQLIEETDDFRIIYHKSIFERIIIKD